MHSSKKKLSYHIKPVFNERFPQGYLNNVEGWGIPKDQLHKKLDDGTYALLTLDIDFGNVCSLSCPHCFRKSKFLNSIKISSLTYEELLSLLKQAKKLGLQGVKFLGAGEPFENPEILKFLVELNRLKIKSAIFTKGHVLGSDELTRKYYSKYGLTSAIDLVYKLKSLNVSILLGFNSFNKQIQEDFIGGSKCKIKNYVDLRDNALINLSKAGFNEYIPGKATRLALIVAPLKPENVFEVFGIYKWGRIRNIYTLSCPTTFSGRGKNELKREKTEYDFEEYIGNLKKLYADIYIWNIKSGLMTLEQFIEDGISLYPGCHPCNQVAAGFYITSKGKVIRCPGRDDNNWLIINDIRRSNIKDVWINSPNYKLATLNKFNYYCIARDGTFFENPKGFYESIKELVLKKFI